ncbi:MAG: hypothetical protein HY023_08245 [Chloroflexi bacterium]|nr:hypothetical protein [Chloroflexota bacterium]MBI3763705.1 hypothetical protein [Chloroflexota bacterium]
MECKRNRRRWLTFGRVTTLLLTVSLGSHAAESQPILPVVADWSHLLAASARIG